MVDGVKEDSFRLDIEDHHLPTGHPHKGGNKVSQPTRARQSFGMTADELMLGSRRLGGGSKTVVGGRSRAAVTAQKAGRNLLTDDTSGDEIMRRMLGTISTSNASITITNGANARAPTPHLRQLPSGQTTFAWGASPCLAM